jgi:hypothetical protein
MSSVPKTARRLLFGVSESNISWHGATRERKGVVHEDDVSATRGANKVRIALCREAFKFSASVAEEHRSKYRVRGQCPGRQDCLNGINPALRERLPPYASATS